MKFKDCGLVDTVRIAHLALHSSKSSSEWCQLAVSLSRLTWSLYKCAALWRAVYGSSATQRFLGTIREEKGIFSQLSVNFMQCFFLVMLKKVL